MSLLAFISFKSFLNVKSYFKQLHIVENGNNLIFTSKLEKILENRGWADLEKFLVC